eukprot:scaffold877_cov314-Pavlova_lutheri.AAC.5
MERERSEDGTRTTEDDHPIPTAERNGRRRNETTATTRILSVDRTDGDQTVPSGCTRRGCRRRRTSLEIPAKRKGGENEAEAARRPRTIRDGKPTARGSHTDPSTQPQARSKRDVDMETKASIGIANHREERRSHEHVGTIQSPRPDRKAASVRNAGRRGRVHRRTQTTQASVRRKAQGERQEVFPPRARAMRRTPARENATFDPQRHVGLTARDLIPIPHPGIRSHGVQDGQRQGNLPGPTEQPAGATTVLHPLLQDIRGSGRTVRLRTPGMRREAEPRRPLEAALCALRSDAGDRVSLRHARRGAEGVRSRGQVHRSHGQRPGHGRLPQGRPPAEGRLGKAGPQSPDGSPGGQRDEGRFGTRGRVRRSRARGAAEEVRRESARDRPRVERSVSVQPHVFDQHRPRRKPERIPASRNCTRDVRELQGPPLLQWRKAPLCGRADRSGLPQRDRPPSRSPEGTRVHAGGDRALCDPRSKGPSQVWAGEGPELPALPSCGAAGRGQGDRDHVGGRGGGPGNHRKRNAGLLHRQDLPLPDHRGHRSPAVALPTAPAARDGTLCMRLLGRGG